MKQRNAEDILCPYCSKVCKGKQALSNHVTRSHQQEKGTIAARVETVAQGEASINHMLSVLQKDLEVGERVVIPQEFYDEMRLQDAKIQLAIRVAAYSKIKRTVRISEQIDKLSEMIAEKLKTVDLTRASTEFLMKMQESLERILSKDLEFLKTIIDAPGDKNTTSNSLSILVNLMETVSKTQNFKLVQPDILPDDPHERERLRKVAISHSLVKVG